MKLNKTLGDILRELYGPCDNPISAYMSMIGRKGGKSRSVRKLAALAASRAVRLAGIEQRKQQTKKGEA